MPYPNEHAARLRNPDRYARFRRENDKFGAGIHAIWGILANGTVELQTIRFDASKFTVAQAKAWLRKHDYHPILFEAAHGEESRGTEMSKLGLTEGPLGIPQTDAAAKETELLLRGLPEEDRVLKRAEYEDTGAEIVEGERSDVSYVTTDTVDRDREVVVSSGGDWRLYLTNPIVPLAHDYHALPVGRCLWVKRVKRADGDGWKAKTRYHTRPANHEGPWLPDAVWHLVHAGDLRGKSIGFIALKSREPKPAEIEERPELAEARRLITKWHALEYSVCAVPTNPDALVQAVSKARDAGLEIPDELYAALGVAKALEAPVDAAPDPVVPESWLNDPRVTGLTPSQISAEVRRVFVEVMRQMQPVDLAGTRPPTADDILEVLRERIRDIDVRQMVLDEIDRARGRV